MECTCHASSSDSHSLALLSITRPACLDGWCQPLCASKLALPNPSSESQISATIFQTKPHPASSWRSSVSSFAVPRLLFEYCLLLTSCITPHNHIILELVSPSRSRYVSSNYKFLHLTPSRSPRSDDVLLLHGAISQKHILFTSQ